MADRVDLAPAAEHALCIGYGRAQHKESVADPLLADRVEIWNFKLAGTLLLNLDSVLQGVNLFHVSGVLRIDQNADSQQTIPGTQLFPRHPVTAGAVVHRMGVVILIDHLYRHEAVAGIRQRDNHGPRVEVEHRERIESVAVGAHDKVFFSREIIKAMR